MKPTPAVVALLALVLLAGCAGSVEFKQLREKSGMYYELDSTVPYSGKSESWFPNGQKRMVDNYVDGKRQGTSESWYPDGHKASESNYVDGVMVTEVRWDEHGLKKTP